MQLKCQICGQARELQEWTKEYEQSKRLEGHPYICPQCQDKIRHDALDV